MHWKPSNGARCGRRSLTTRTISRTLEVIVSPDRLMAMGAVIARTIGIHKDGSHFERPVRVTATLMREAVGAPWFMTHTHVSLVPGTPAPSYGNRPEAE